VITVNIHGLLAKRAGGRYRIHREAQKSTYCCEVDSGLHHSVLTIRGGRQGGDPGVGVYHIAAAEALGVAGRSTGNKTLEGLTVDLR
jgi:hypothetical protein